MFGNSFEIFRLVMNMEQKRINHNNLLSLKQNTSRKRDIMKHIRRR